MSIENILINVADVQRSVDFYTSFLGAQVVGDVTGERAELDLVTATIRLVRATGTVPSTWIGDDLQRGFRHIGFKVAEVDPLVEVLDEAGVSFHLRPIDAEGGVRITFFFDPDGTLLELVSGDIQYHDIADEAGVAKERALGIPDRPRFDHVAVTSASLQSAEEFYAPFGFGRIGSIHQPQDPRGFEIDYLKGGDTVLEVFTFGDPETFRPPQLDALGFVCVDLSPESGAGSGTAPLGTASDGRPVYSDADGLLYSISR